MTSVWMDELVEELVRGVPSTLELAILSPRPPISLELVAYHEHLYDTLIKEQKDIATYVGNPLFELFPGLSLWFRVAQMYADAHRYLGEKSTLERFRVKDLLQLSLLLKKYSPLANTELEISGSSIYFRTHYAGETDEKNSNSNTFEHIVDLYLSPKQKNSELFGRTRFLLRSSRIGEFSPDTRPPKEGTVSLDPVVDFDKELPIKFKPWSIFCDTRNHIQPTESSLDGEETMPSCIACLETVRETVFSPCHHFIFCEACAKRVTVCPVCRGGIESRVKVVW
jgi:hypothetical protein